ncbi:hypothetical protein Glove_117g548 [Diversispora epigaea]|uniref:Uncharacterized protein n=1 Tax=Diversispora epigaea TaxID=1348612 RepID=A0A397J9Z8_9GLOM|nr:hypothetical protein Glove_117g548 [Diversispora epigaea]
MNLLTVCLNELKTHDFWESVDNPSLKKYLDFRFQKGVLKDKKTDLSCISSVTNYPVNCGWQREKTWSVGEHVISFMLAFSATL